MEMPTGLNVADLTAYATIGSTAIAIMAFFISVWTGRIQRQHNRLSVRPLPEIQLRDMDGHIRVKLINNGTGPLIIERLAVLESGKVVGSSLIELMPAGFVGWTFFVHVVDGRSIAPNGEIVLIDLEYDSRDSAERRFAMSVRGILRALEVRVEYSSIYGNALPVYEKELDWFGRLL